MNLRVEKTNAGNKIVMKSYGNDNGYWLIMSVCENITVARRSKIYTFDRVDVRD